MNQEPLLYSIPEWSELMGWSESTTRREIRDGKIRVVKIRGLSKITASESQRYLTTKTEEQHSATAA